MYFGNCKMQAFHLANMPRQARPKCCICFTGTTSRCYSTKGSEEKINSCFEPAKSRFGSCAFHKNSDVLPLYGHLVDSKRKRGQFGKREVRGQRANVELKSIGTVIEKPKPGHLDLPDDILIDIFYMLDNCINFAILMPSTETITLVAFMVMMVCNLPAMRHTLLPTSVLENVLNIQLQKDQKARMYSKFLLSEIEKAKEATNRLEGDLSNTRKELESLRSVEDHMALTSNQESLFRQLTKHNEANSPSGLLTAYNPRGRPKDLVCVRKAEIGSSEASASTVQARSQIAEKSASVSTSSSCSNTAKEKTDRIAQKTSLLNRRKDEYVEAVQNAGVKLLAKFSKETV